MAVEFMASTSSFLGGAPGTARQGVTGERKLFQKKKDNGKGVVR